MGFGQDPPALCLQLTLSLCDFCRPHRKHASDLPRGRPCRCPVAALPRAWVLEVPASHALCCGSSTLLGDSPEQTFRSVLSPTWPTSGLWEIATRPLVPCGSGPLLLGAVSPVCPAKASPQPTASRHCTGVSHQASRPLQTQGTGVRCATHPIEAGLSACVDYGYTLLPTIRPPPKGRLISPRKSFHNLLSPVPDLFIPLVLVSSLTCFTLKYLHGGRLYHVPVI